MTWSMHTNGTITLNGSHAVLRQGGQALHAVLLEPQGAAFEEFAVDLQPPQLPTPGVRKLVVVATPRARRILVSLSLREGAPLPGVNLNELAAWDGSGPFTARD